MSVDNAVPPGPAGFSTTIRHGGDEIPEAHIIACSGELDLSTSGQLEDAITSVSEGHIVTDLSEVTFMDSTGVSVLVGNLQRMSEEDRRLVVVCPPGVPRRVLSLTGLEEMLHTCDRLQDAGVLLGA